jgi:hypothetical protein
MVTEDVIDGVEAIQLEFGVALDSNADDIIDGYKFIKTPQTSSWSALDWGDMVSVRFSLLLREEKPDPNYDGSTRTYAIEDYPSTGDTGFTPNKGDRYHRSMIQSTVLLRNPEFIIQGG